MLTLRSREKYPPNFHYLDLKIACYCNVSAFFFKVLKILKITF